MNDGRTSLSSLAFASMLKPHLLISILTLTGTAECVEPLKPERQAIGAGEEYLRKGKVEKICKGAAVEQRTYRTLTYLLLMVTCDREMLQGRRELKQRSPPFTEAMCDFVWRLPDARQDYSFIDR